MDENALTVVMCHGAFDLLHIGHIHHLKRAAEFGDRLVVSITADRFISKGDGHPLFSHDNRAATIKQLKFVDEVFVCFGKSAVHAIEIFMPDIYCKGGDYLNEDPLGNLEKEKEALNKYGGVLRILPDDIRFSSTEIMTGKLFEKRVDRCRPF